METQREGITSYCNAHGLDLVETYTDEGVSGSSTEKRPEFKRMLQDAKEKKFGYLVVRSLSRFGRNTIDTLNNYDLLENQGVKLVFLKENIDTSTPTGRMFRNIMAVLAEWERDTIKERMLGGRKAKWKKFETFPAKTPYGYKWNQKKKKLEIVREEADIYRKIVKLYLHEGLSDLNIAMRLKEEGIKLRGREYASLHTLANMLKNPAYCGNYVLNRYEYDGRKRTKKRRNRPANT